MMTDEMAGRVLEAYKTSPLLTGLLILNLVFLLGFGWFLKGKNEQHEKLVADILQEEREFRRELSAAYANCQPSEAIQPTNPLPTRRPVTSGKPGYQPIDGY